MDLSTVNWENISLTFAALVVVGILWRELGKVRTEFKAEIEEHKKTLREANEGRIYDLVARVKVVEDKLQIPRDEKFKYMPPLNERERAALQNLDMTPAHEFSDASSERDKR
jgi:hypothetical protein